jgi:glycosyltransferase involved in cell wall biosynthesis
MPPIPVLFTHFGEDWVRGSETVLLDLLTHLDRDRITPVVWCNADAMAEACRALGVPTAQSPFEFYFDYNRPPFSPGRYLGLVREGMRLVRQHGIRVLHANSAAPTQWLAPVATFTGRPLVAHLHIDYLRRSRYALLLHMADVVVGVSRQVTDDFVADGMPQDRLRVIYNGIDFARIPTARSDLRATLGIPRDALVVASVGSLVRRKGHDLLLRAFAALPATAPAPHLVLGSDGEMRAELEALAQSLGIAERTHFLGYTDDLVAIYEAADIFALATRADAFGLVLAEAGHFGLPVVSTRVGGVPEVIADGETGLLVPPEDVPALTEALGRLTADPALRRQLGAQGRQRVDRMFTVQRMAAEFQDCYAELAEHRPARLRAARFTPYARLLTGARPRG